MPSAFLLRASPTALHRSKAELLGCEGWELAGHAQHGRAALERLPLLQPDLLLADLRLLDGPVERLLLHLRELPLQLPVLLWSRGGDEAQLADLMLLGVRGLLPDSAGTVALQAALDGALQQRHALSPVLARELLRRLGAPRLAAARAAQPDMAGAVQAAGWLQSLSVAQQALLSLLAHGYLPGEIGQCWRMDRVDVERRVGQLLRLLPCLVPSPLPEAPALAA